MLWGEKIAILLAQITQVVEEEEDEIQEKGLE